MQIIGLLAGKGELPYKILQHCLQHNKPIVLVAFEGQTDSDLINLQEKHSQNFVWANFGAVGKILRFLKENKVTHLVMAGAMERPSWSGLKLDWKGAQWFAKMGLAKTGASASGDDWLLKKIIHMLKNEGFEVISAGDILDDLLAPEGIMGLHQPQETDWQDIKQGKEITRLLGIGDIGQAVVIQQGLVLGVEAIEGTEALLVRCGSLRRKGRGGVLVKMAKPHQSRAVDLPTIGVSTVHQAHKAGLCGIAIEAGSTQILDKQAVIEAADAAGLYLVGIRHS
ncbi:MAG: LpxI family protein [Alphaproteobacteria bacterium]|nr:LpxI family protein [Alphaproteobacteria bacterium]